MSKKTRKEKVLEALGDGTWVDGYALCHPTIGGSEGLRRLRELRADGHEIEKRKKPGSSAYQYRLVIDEDECTCLWSYTEKFKAIEARDDECPAAPHPSLMRL